MTLKINPVINDEMELIEISRNESNEWVVLFGNVKIVKI